MYAETTDMYGMALIHLSRLPQAVNERALALHPRWRNRQQADP